MKKVLVLAPPEDREDRAVALAAKIAEHTHVALTLLRVIEPIPERVSARLLPPISDLLENTATERMEERAYALRAAGIPVRIELDHGVAWQAVLDRVGREHFDLVVKPASGLSKDGPVFFGSTALHLFRRCPCPVWVVGGAGRVPDRVVAAIDTSEGDRRRLAANSVLDWAEEIACWSDALPEVVTVWRSLSSTVADLKLDQEELEFDREFSRSRAEEALSGMLLERGATFTRDQVHLVEGSPAAALPRFARVHETDLLVMGTLARPDSIGDLIGETAESIIRQVRCSVLTVPPGSHPSDVRGASPESRDNERTSGVALTEKS